MSRSQFPLNDDILQRAIGNVIRRQRELMNKTIDEVAWGVETDTLHLSKIERGEVEVYSYLFTKLQLYLDFTFNDYLEEYQRMLDENTP